MYLETNLFCWSRNFLIPFHALSSGDFLHFQLDAASDLKPDFSTITE